MGKSLGRIELFELFLKSSVSPVSNPISSLWQIATTLEFFSSFLKCRDYLPDAKSSSGEWYLLPSWSKFDLNCYLLAELFTEKFFIKRALPGAVPHKSTECLLDTV